MKKLIIWGKFLLLILFFILQSEKKSLAGEPDLLITSVTIIDGQDSIPLPAMDLEIKAGKISRIGTGLKNDLARKIDGTGLYIMPGLIDCHTHLYSVPGALQRKDSAEKIRNQQLLQLKMYLAAGVTTVLDAAASESLLIDAEKMQKDGIAAPRILGLAPFLTPEGGYFSDSDSRDLIYKDLWSPVNDEDTVRKHFSRAANLNPVGVKVTFESGLGPVEIWPVFGKNVQDLIRSEAKKYQMPIFAHSMSEEEHLLALKVKPYAFVHAGFYEEEPGAEILAKMKKSNAYVTSTISIFKMMKLMFEPEELADPWLKSLVTEEQLLTALDPQVTADVQKKVVRGSAPPWVPDFIVNLFYPFIFNEQVVQKTYENAQKSIKIMSDAGLPLVMGSDSGNWPVWTTFFHGVGSILEMEALEASGIPRSEIIRMATSRAAKMLKIDQQVGTVTEGKTADLLLTSENPVQNIRALRKIKWVIKDGIIKTPAEWQK